MKSPILISLLISWSMLAQAKTTCETSKVTFALPNSSSQACRSLKLAGTHTIKLCDNNRGNFTTAGGRDYFLFVDKNLWKFREEQLNFSTKTSESETLSMDFENKSFNYLSEKRKQDGTLLKKITCDGVLEVKN